LNQFTLAEDDQSKTKTVSINFARHMKSLIK
jgi:hypothetical protein